MLLYKLEDNLRPIVDDRYNSLELTSNSKNAIIKNRPHKIRQKRIMFYNFEDVKYQDKKYKKLSVYAARKWIF